MPEPGDLYIDGDLSQVSIRYRNAGYVAERMLPLIESRAKFGKYPIFGFERFSVPRTLRAPRARVERVEWTLSRDTFECDEHSLEQPLDDQERAQNGSINAETTTVETVTDMILLAREKRTADLLTDSSIITQHDDLSGTEQWNNAEYVSTPMEDVKAGHTAIAAATGLRANRLLLPRAVLDALEMHPQILERVSVTGSVSNARIVTPQILAVVFGVDEIVIADTLYNSAKEGAAVDLDPVWGDNVVLAHVVEGPGERPRVGCTIWWGEMGPQRVVGRYREGNIKSDVFQITEHTDECIQAAAAAYLLKDVLA